MPLELVGNLIRDTGTATGLWVAAVTATGPWVAAVTATAAVATFEGTKAHYEKFILTPYR